MRCCYLPRTKIIKKKRNRDCRKTQQNECNRRNGICYANEKEVIKKINSGVQQPLQKRGVPKSQKSRKINKLNKMRKNLILLASTVALLVGFSACKTQKPIQNVTGSTEISLPFSGKEYQSDKENFRAKQIGKSPDLATSKKIALQNAKAELAGNIQAIVKRVTDQYTNQRTVATTQDFENKFEELSREVVNQTLADVKIIGEKTFKETDGSYSYWIAVEMSKTSVLDGINNKISKDAKLLLDYDKKKFEETFNNEMQKLENEK